MRGKLSLVGSSHRHSDDLSPTIDIDTQGNVYFCTQSRKTLSKFWCNKYICWKGATIQMAQTAHLVVLNTLNITVNLFYDLSTYGGPNNYIRLRSLGKTGRSYDLLV